MKKISFLFLLIFPLFLFSQKKENKNKEDDFYIIKNDSLTIPLDEIIVFKRLTFDSTKEKKYYYWYSKKVQKAYPYAKLASEKLTEINNDLEGITSNRKRKKQVRKIQNYMEGEFTDELKKMTRTEGRIMIKLINRQTGETLYDLIKEYRSGFKAFWYNSSAKVFKLNLKTEYHPESIALDFIVEDILQRSFANGTLERQPTKLHFDYFELKNEWKDIEVISAIDAYIEKYK